MGHNARITHNARSPEGRGKGKHMETIIMELAKETDPEIFTIYSIVISHRIFEDYGLDKIGEEKFSTIIYSLILEYFEGGGKAEEAIIRFIDILKQTAEKQKGKGNDV